MRQRFFPLDPPPPGLPAAIARPFKATSPQTHNLNHWAVVDLSRQFLDDDLAAIRHAPFRYARTIGRSLALHFQPVSASFHFYPNRDALGIWDSFFNNVLCGQWGRTGGVGWHLVILYLAGLGLGGAALRAMWRRRNEGGGLDARFTVILFLMFTIVSATLVSNALDYGENTRFRLETEPLALALLAGAWVAWRESRAARQ